MTPRRPTRRSRAGALRAGARRAGALRAGALRAGALSAAGLAVGLAATLAACAPGTAQGYASPPPSLDPGSPTLAAKDVAFDRETLDVPAGRPFILVFENLEAVDHNVSIYADAALQQRRFEGVLFGGPATRWYPVPSLEAGTYVFVCDLHPSMRGLVEAR
jgi:plastocyanin